MIRTWFKIMKRLTLKRGVTVRLLFKKRKGVVGDCKHKTRKFVTVLRNLFMFQSDYFLFE